MGIPSSTITIVVGQEGEEENMLELKVPDEEFVGQNVEPNRSCHEREKSASLMEKETMEFKKERLVREKSFKKAETIPYSGLSKLESLLREKALKKPMLKSVDEKSKKKRLNMGEKLMGSSMKAARKSESSSSEVEEVFESKYRMINRFNRKRRYRRERRVFQSMKRRNRGKRNTRYVYESETESDSDEEPGLKFSNRPNREQPLDLPEIFKELIQFVEGTDTKLVMQKQLSLRDVSLNYNRAFLIPASQIEESFLMKDEEEVLNIGDSIESVLFEPIISVSHETLRKKARTSSYVLSMDWNKVVIDNELRVGDGLQLWSFRILEKLGFLFVKVPRLEVEDDQEIY